MSNSAILKSSLAKKYWMAATGLFLCLFLVGHLLGNLQLIFKTGEEGRHAFNEYAYFMGHNVFIKAMSWITYISILFHAIDGIVLTVKNHNARPVKYAHNNANANSKWYSRSMAILGTLILVFIATHMANFWYHQKVSEDVPLEKIVVSDNHGNSQEFYVALNNNYYPVASFEKGPNGEEPQLEFRHTTEVFTTQGEVRMGEVYKDLHTVVMKFFNKNENSLAIVYLAFYVFSMAVLAFHLSHGFASAFQSLGLNSHKYTPAIKLIGSVFAILVPLAFAIIPIIIFFRG